MLFQKSQNYITKGKAWVQCIGALDPLRFWHVSSFIQFLYTYQNLNGSSAKPLPITTKDALQIHYH